VRSARAGARCRLTHVAGSQRLAHKW